MVGNNAFDICIVGSGPAGTFAALKIAKEHKNAKIILIDLGRPGGKRKHQMSGFLGCFPSSDGKLYLSDMEKLADITTQRKINSAYNWFNNYTKNIFDFKTIKDNGPKASTEKKIRKSGYDIVNNDYIQTYPKQIHNLSRAIVKDMDDKIFFSFDNEVYNVTKNKNIFTIDSERGQFTCKKILICAGRSGWRWTKSLYDKFKIIKNNDYASFGIRVEAPSLTMKDFSGSNCSIFNNDIELGPICWNGTVIPEDHVDMAISSFRSNEDRWHTEKVSFNLIKKVPFKNSGFEQTDRLGQLTFILSNDRVVKERITKIINNESKLSIIPEYNWLPDALTELHAFIPDVINKGYFHVPTILPMLPKINVNKDLLTSVPGLYCAGESAGAPGLLNAMLSGLIAADSICK
jgi:uncharacterized protein